MVKETISERTLRVERIDALAALSGGTTHELNNILATVLMSLDLFRKACSGDSALALLTAVEEAARRGLQLTRQLQWLARGTASEPVLFQPRFLLNDAQNLVSASLPRSILVMTEYTPDLRLLRGDPLLVYQLILALLLESSQELEGAGTLTLAARNLDVAVTRGALEPGGYVSFEVRIQAAPARSPAEATFGLHTATENHSVSSASLVLATGAVIDALPDGECGRRVCLLAADTEEKGSQVRNVQPSS